MKQNLAKQTSSEGLLLARPAQAAGRASLSRPQGLHRLELGCERDGLLYVPAGYNENHLMPLALLLHGAGGNAQHGLSLLQNYADDAGLILLAPDARQQTWDVIVNHYGTDVAYIDLALEQTFSRYAIDPTRIAAGGFSDGASYALSVGIINGDLFTHVIAFSPGFMSPTRQKGSPRLFISHGTQDRVLPIDRCSRRIVPQVERAGYDVRYLEFDGPHTIPPEIVRNAVDWFVE